MDTSTDHGTVVAPTDWATIWSPDKGWLFLVPGDKNIPDGIVPDEALALTAAFLRLSREPEFVEECLDWIRRAKNG